MLSVTNKPVILSVKLLNVVMRSAMAPLKMQLKKIKSFLDFQTYEFLPNVSRCCPN